MEKQMNVPDDIADSVIEDSSEGAATGHPQLEMIPDSGLRSTDGDVVGRVARVPEYGCKAYWCTKNDEKHRLHNGEGYAIDKPIVEKLAKEWDDVEKVFIGLRLSRDVLEFSLDQYLEGEFFNYVGPQLCVPEREVERVWPDALDTMVQND